MRISTRSVLMALALLGAGALAQAAEPEWAFNAPRGEGYRIDLVSVEPAPGTPLQVNSTVDFKVTVKYSLTAAKKGTIILVPQGEKGSLLEEGEKQVSQEVTGPEGTVTLTQTLKMPRRGKLVYLFVPLSPEGMSETTGEVTLLYPLVKR